MKFTESSKPCAFLDEWLACFNSCHGIRRLDMSGEKQIVEIAAAKSSSESLKIGRVKSKTLRRSWRKLQLHSKFANGYCEEEENFEVFNIRRKKNEVTEITEVMEQARSVILKKLKKGLTWTMMQK
jgi:hypothetical protein